MIYLKYKEIIQLILIFKEIRIFINYFQYNGYYIFIY